MSRSNKSLPIPERNLTKAEEQIMQALWQCKTGFLKDVIEAMPIPKPHNNTVATLLKILIDKGYVQAETTGRNHVYKPLIAKETYGQNSMGKLVTNYFNGSYTSAVSFLVDQKQLSVHDLEILLNELKNK